MSWSLRLYEPISQKKKCGDVALEGFSIAYISALVRETGSTAALGCTARLNLLVVPNQLKRILFTGIPILVYKIIKHYAVPIRSKDLYTSH